MQKDSCGDNLPLWKQIKQLFNNWLDKLKTPNYQGNRYGKCTINGKPVDVNINTGVTITQINGRTYLNGKIIGDDYYIDGGLINNHQLIIYFENCVDCVFTGKNINCQSIEGAINIYSERDLTCNNIKCENLGVNGSIDCNNVNSTNIEVYHGSINGNNIRGTSIKVEGL